MVCTRTSGVRVVVTKLQTLAGQAEFRVPTEATIAPVSIPVAGGARRIDTRRFPGKGGPENALADVTATGIEEFGPTMNPHWRDVLTTLSDSASFVVLAFAVFGGVALVLTRRRDAVFVVASTVCFAAVPVILFGDPRYRVPAEPLFMILAAVAACATVDGVTRLRA